MSALITTRPPSPTHERMLSSVSDSTARPHAERTDAELQSIVSTAQAEIDQRKAERLQLQEERREFEATRKRLAETEAELDKRAAKQQRQTGHTNSENSTSNHQLTVLAVLPASASGDVVSFKSLVAQLANNPMLSISVKRGIYELGEAYRVQDKASFFGKLKELVGKELIKRALLALRAASSVTDAAAVSCSSSHAAPLAATKPVRQKQKRKASHVLVGPDVLLKEHVECARVDGTTVVRATNGGASSYAIEEMD